uniref:glutamate carboxypeptidase II n=1 Tax=Oryza meridionalis TaxID=40149 RepID=A0A0E0DZ27_9ORYZ
MSRHGKPQQRQPLILPDAAPMGGGDGGRGDAATRRRRFVAFLAISVALVASYHHLAPAPASRYHALFVSLGNNDTAAAHLRALTLRPHVAGTEANAVAAEYVRAALSSFSFPTRVTPYSVLLSYPIHRSLSLSVPGRAAAFNFALVQETYPGDPYSEAAAEVIPTYFAYSASGSVAADVVYANYGNTKDYEYLASRGVDVAGKVALVRYGNLHCEDMVRNARAAGAAAAIVYTDAKDFGGAGAKGKRKWFPDARWLPPTGVQVGTLYYGNGDPTTPLWPSCAAGEDCERLSKGELDGSAAMPGIPALPVSARDGEMILKAMGGDAAPTEWQGGEGAPLYRLGPGPAVLNLTYIGNDTLATIENVFAVIEGKEEPDRYVIIGNHRDAWTFGAVDPNSGTAAMLEIAERLSKLEKKGWRPRRTIIVCSWDAEEFALIGSTEWVEDNMDMLASRAIAYLNVDITVFGPGGFRPRATPQLDQLIKEASKMVQDPDDPSQTLYDTMIRHHPPIDRVAGAGTDFAAFLQYIGVPSLDMSYGTISAAVTPLASTNIIALAVEDYPVYHSLYDDYVWMERFGDPLFHRHVALASVWGLIALRLADDEILPLNYVSYASELEKCTKLVEGGCTGCPVSFAPLHKSIDQLRKAANKIHKEKMMLQAENWSLKTRAYTVKVRDINERLMMAERGFINREGLDGRPWYKHMIYASSDQDDWGTKAFPGIVSAIDKANKLNTTESWHLLQHEIYRAARAVSKASAVLDGRLT